MSDSIFGATEATPDSLAVKRKMALLLMRQGADTSPVQAWSQGAARIAQGLLGAYTLSRADQDESDIQGKTAAFQASLLGGGSPPAAPMASPAPSPSPEVSPVVGALSQPRGYRNNNPLNIEAGSFTQGQPGFAGSDGRFAKFDSMDGGTAAANKLLDTYQNKYGLNTPAGIIGRWAPSADGNNVSAYAGQVAKALGIGPNDPIPPEMRSKLVAAMAQHENGKPMPNQQVASLDPSIGVAPPAPQQPTAQPLQQVAQAQTAPQAVPQQGINQRIIEALQSKDPNIRRAAMGMVPGIIQQMLKPSEYDFKERPDGSLVAVNKKNPGDVRVVNAPGGGQAAIDYKALEKAAVTKAEMEAKKAVGEPDRRKQEVLSGGIVVQDIDRAIKQMDTAILPTTGAVGDILSNIGGTAARNVRGLIDTVKANAGFAELSKMRAASPTGGALGQVTEKELALLQATTGNLEQSQTDDQLRDNLKRLKNVYMDIIHGPGNGPREPLAFEKSTAPAPGKTAPPVPKAGDSQDGYMFKGGDPSKPENWQKVL